MSRVSLKKIPRGSPDSMPLTRPPEATTAAIERSVAAIGRIQEHLGGPAVHADRDRRKEAGRGRRAVVKPVIALDQIDPLWEKGLERGAVLTGAAYGNDHCF